MPRKPTAPKAPRKLVPAKPAPTPVAAPPTPQWEFKESQNVPQGNRRPEFARVFVTNVNAVLDDLKVLERMGTQEDRYHFTTAEWEQGLRVILEALRATDTQWRWGKVRNLKFELRESDELPPRTGLQFQKRLSILIMQAVQNGVKLAEIAQQLRKHAGIDAV